MEEPTGALILDLPDVSLLAADGSLLDVAVDGSLLDVAVDGTLLDLAVDSSSKLVEIDWASAPEAGAWAAGAWGPGPWRRPTSHDYEDRGWITQEEIDATQSNHWSVTNSGVEIDRWTYNEMRKVQLEFAVRFGLQEERNATNELYLPCAVSFEEIKHKFNDPDNVALCEMYDQYRELILPGLWFDIYRPLDGARPLEVKLRLEEILKAAKKISDGILARGNEALPVPFAWWVELDQERRRKIIAIERNRKIKMGKLD